MPEYDGVKVPEVGTGILDANPIGGCRKGHDEATPGLPGRERRGPGPARPGTIPGGLIGIGLTDRPSLDARTTVRGVAVATATCPAGIDRRSNEAGTETPRTIGCLGDVAPGKLGANRQDATAGCLGDAAPGAGAIKVNRPDAAASSDEFPGAGAIMVNRPGWGGGPPAKAAG